jgi:hypothetical protein
MSYPHYSPDCQEHHGLVRDFGGSTDKMARPEIVVLCGSTRHALAFEQANLRLTLAGKIVLTIGCNLRDEFHRAEVTRSGLGDVKPALDELHKRKIDLADRVYVLNVGGYVGESTRSEIAYALANGKLVTYLEHEPNWPTQPSAVGR